MKLRFIDYIQFIIIFLVIGVAVLIPMRLVNKSPAITYVSMAICITTAFIIIFNFFGTYRLIRQISGEVDKLSTENKLFSTENRKFSEENNKLSNNCKILETENIKFSEENNKLIESCKLLESTNNKFSDNLQLLNEENKNLNNKLQLIGEENEKFRKSNIQLLEIQKQSQQLVSTLMISGDKFTDFGKILEETTNKNLSLTEKLQILTTKLSKETFKKLDKNGDGFLTIDELEN